MELEKRLGSEVVLPDEDHVRIEGHLVHIDDRDQRHDYFAHDDCWRESTAG